MTDEERAAELLSHWPSIEASHPSFVTALADAIRTAVQAERAAWRSKHTHGRQTLRSAGMKVRLSTNTDLENRLRYIHDTAEEIRTRRKDDADLATIAYLITYLAHIVHKHVSEGTR